MKRLILLSLVMVLGLSVCNAQKRYKRSPAPLASNIKYHVHEPGVWKISSKDKVTGPKAKNSKPVGTVKVTRTRITGPKAKNKRVGIKK